MDIGIIQKIVKHYPSTLRYLRGRALLIALNGEELPWKHMSPTHPGTGTPQSVHAGGGGGISSFESGIAGNSYESAAAYSKDGKLLFTKDGTAHGVNFTEAEFKQMNDATLIHNHPDWASNDFSPDDIVMAVTGNLREIRAVHTNGTYVFTRPADGWGWETGSNVKNYFYRQQEKWLSNNDRKDTDAMLKFIWDGYASEIGATHILIEK